MPSVCASPACSRSALTPADCASVPRPAPCAATGGGAGGTAATVAGAWGGGAAVGGGAGGGGGAKAGATGGDAAPKPPRAQSTTLDCANLPQISSAAGGGGAAIGLDQSDAGLSGSCAGVPHVEGPVVSAIGVGEPQPETGGGAGDATAPQPADGGSEGVATGGGAAGGGAPQPPEAGVDAAVGGAAQLCDIGPVPEIADPTGRASQLDAWAAGAAPPASDVQPFQFAGVGSLLRSAARAAEASSSAATISNGPT